MLSAAESYDLKDLTVLLKPLKSATKELWVADIILYFINISEMIPIFNCLMIKISSPELQPVICVKAKEVLQEQI